MRDREIEKRESERGCDRESEKGRARERKRQSERARKARRSRGKERKEELFFMNITVKTFTLHLDRLIGLVRRGKIQK